MKCDNCRFLRTEGYEYPKTYCGAGVAEDDERVTVDGCSYHYKTLEKRERELDEAWDKAHIITDEDYERLFSEDLPPVKLGNKNTTGKCGMCGINVKKLYPCKVGQVEFMICVNCKSIMDM